MWGLGSGLPEASFLGKGGGGQVSGCASPADHHIHHRQQSCPWSAPCKAVPLLSGAGTASGGGGRGLGPPQPRLEAVVPALGSRRCWSLRPGGRCLWWLFGGEWACGRWWLLEVVLTAAWGYRLPGTGVGRGWGRGMGICLGMGVALGTGLGMGIWMRVWV